MERGPEELIDLPHYFGHKGKPPDLSRYDVRIFAEIVDAPQLSIDEILQRAAAYAADGADAMIIVTEWNQFRSLDMVRVRSLLRKPVVVDLRNLYDPQRMKDQGFHYSSVGRAAKDLPGG